MTPAVDRYAPMALRIARQKGYDTVEAHRAAREAEHLRHLARVAAEREAAAAARRAARVLREVAPFRVAAGAAVYERASDGRVQLVPVRVLRAKLLPGNIVGAPVGLATLAEVREGVWFLRVMDHGARPVADLEVRHRWEADYALDAMGGSVAGAMEFADTYQPIPA